MPVPLIQPDSPFHPQVLDFQQAIGAPKRRQCLVIVALHAPVIGLGIDLISYCDIRYAASDTTFYIKVLCLLLLSAWLILGCRKVCRHVRADKRVPNHPHQPTFWRMAQNTSLLVFLGPVWSGFLSQFGGNRNRDRFFLYQNQRDCNWT